MKRLTIFEILDNIKDVLSRAEDLLAESMVIATDDIEQELLLDVRANLDRMSDIKERIEFALILAVYAGEYNMMKDGDRNCDFSSWRESYLKSASDVEFVYNEDGKIASDEMFNMAEEIVLKLFIDKDSN